MPLMFTAIVSDTVQQSTDSHNYSKLAGHSKFSNVSWSPWSKDIVRKKFSFLRKDDQPVKPRMLTVKSTTPLSQNSRCSDPTSMILTKSVSNRPLRRPPAASIQALAALLCTFNKESIFNDASLSCILRKGLKFALFAEIFRTFTGWYLFTAGIESSRPNQMLDWEWEC
jgi:hypothetical protein